MKTLLLLISIFLTTLTLAQQNNSFSLQGQTKNIPDGTVLLVQDAVLEKMIDSVKVINNSFTLKTTLPDYPYKISLWRDSSTAKTIWVENNKMTLDASDSGFEEAVITGSVTNALALQLRDKQHTLKSYEDKVAIEFDFINNNPDNILSAHSLSIMAAVFGKAKSAALFEKFSEKNKQSPYGKKISTFLDLDNPDTPKVGKRYADFEMKDQNGIPHKLSEFEGKLTLLEFWASWCVPCRLENPNLLNTYNQFKDSGFEIVAVSLDENKEYWMSAIKKDKLPWKHLSDLKGRDNKAALIYSVGGVPDNILIDKNGIVIGRNLRREALSKLIAENLAVPVKTEPLAAGVTIKLKRNVVWQDETGKVLSKEEGELRANDNQYSLDVDTEKNIMTVKKRL
jgi:peroxiredoxin